MTGPVRTARAAGVATISLDAPASGNALSLELLGSLREAVLAAADDPAVGVVLLRAEGDLFSVGGLIDEMAAAADRAAYMEEIGRLFNPTVAALHETDLITVAAVRGAVAGGAIGLMSAADVIFAARGTVFTFAYSKIGASFDGGGSWLTRRDVGYRKAIELFLTSERIDADAALELGLINRVLEPDDLEAAAAEFAATVAAGPLAASLGAKRLLREAAEAPLERQLEAEIAAFAAVAAGADFERRTAGFLARRKGGR